MSKTNLVVTLNGTSEREDGNINVVNEKYEDVRAILQFAFMNVTEEGHVTSVACIGGFSRQYYVEIIEKLREAIGEKEFEAALSYVRVKEIVKKGCGLCARRR